MPKKKVQRTPKTPSLVALLACDAVSRDPNTRKATLYGIFHAIEESNFPTRYRPFAIYGELIGDGDHEVSFWVDSPTEKPQKIGTVQINCEPDKRASLAIEIAGYQFETAGTYDFQLRIGRKILKPTCPISVRKKKVAPKKKR